MENLIDDMKQLRPMNTFIQLTDVSDRESDYEEVKM